MKQLLTLTFLFIATFTSTAKSYDNPDTIVVARDGTGEFRNISEAVEVCRAFMDYHKVIFVKRGVYKEKIVLPQSLTNIEICGEDRDNTIITWDDHANILYPPTGKPMGTFRTFTLRIDGSYITLKNITVENNAARLGQAVALFTVGDKLTFVNCRFLGHQDTIYTGNAHSRQLFKDCYIEGTTDFIFGPATAWFLPRQIRPEGWHHWQKNREQTARYLEYNNRGEGAATQGRVAWSRQLTKKEAQAITPERVFSINDQWNP